MHSELEKLLQTLGEAINEAVSDSDEVNDALDGLRAVGFEAMLVLEATVAFKEKSDDEPPRRTIPVEQRLAELSHEDRQFLRSLNIKFDGDEQ